MIKNPTRTTPSAFATVQLTDSVPSYWLGYSFSLSFELRTAEQYPQHHHTDGGLLWVWASYRNYSRYFVLRMDSRGFLQLDLQGNRGRARALHYRATRLDDARWHRVQLTKRDSMLTLKVPILEYTV